jgi:DNA-binding NarL/FixJ family response regulator
MGFRRRKRPDHLSEARPRYDTIRVLRGRSDEQGRSDIETRLTFEVDGHTSARLRRAARDREQSPESLLADMLQSGLEQEIRRAHAEATLETLTPREQEVIWLAARGYTNRQMADALVISPETVKTHIRSVLAKFGLRSKAELRLLLLDLGLRWWQEHRPQSPS